jgi:hypothetical protein
MDHLRGGKASPELFAPSGAGTRINMVGAVIFVTPFSKTLGFVRECIEAERDILFAQLAQCEL